MHRLDDGMPPRPSTAGRKEQPYIKLCDYVKSSSSSSHSSPSFVGLNIVSSLDEKNLPCDNQIDEGGDDRNNKDEDDSDGDGNGNENYDKGDLNMTALLVPDLAPSGLKMSTVATSQVVSDDDDDDDDDDDLKQNEDKLTQGDLEVHDVESAIEVERMEREKREWRQFQQFEEEQRMAIQETGRYLSNDDDVLAGLADDTNVSFDRSPVADAIMYGEHEGQSGGVVTQMNIRSKLKIRREQNE